MKVLITGAKGFLGEALTTTCKLKGWDTICVVSNKQKYPHENVYEIKDVLGQSFDLIFNVAAFIPYGAYNLADQRYIISNIDLPVTLYKSFPTTKIVFVSSVSVYGNHSEIIKENSFFNQPLLYGLSKLSGEMITMQHKEYSILRFSSLYGKKMNSSTFIPKIIQQAKEKSSITLIGEGLRSQNYLYIDDAIQYCLQAAIKGKNEIYLGVEKQSYTNLEVAKYVVENIPNCKIHFEGIDKSPSFIYDNTYTRNELNFTPIIDLKTGIKKMIADE